jgi:Lipoprotein NlpI, contains TPR repeats
MLPLFRRWVLVSGLVVLGGVALAANDQTLTEQELIEEAVAAYSLGDYAKAEARLSELIERRPEFAEGYFNRSLTRYALEKLAEAESDLDVYLSMEPEAAKAFEFRSVVRMYQGKVEGALADATVGLRIEERPGFRAVRGRVLAAKGEYEAALTDLEIAVATNEGDDDSRLARGRSYLNLGRSEEARADFEKLAERYPEEWSVIYALSDVRFRLLDFAGTIEALERLRKIDQSEAVVTRQLGYCHFAAGDNDRAIEALQQVLDSVPEESPWAAAVLHLAWLRAKRPGESPLAGVVERIEDPWGKAVCQMLLKQIGEDELVEEAHAEKDPRKQRGRLCEAYYYIGASRLLAGDRIAGRAMLSQAIETNSFSYTEYTLAKADLARKL